MNRRFALAAVLGLLCTPALAIADGYLSLHSDATFNECLLSDTLPGVKNVYLAELAISGASGLRFRISSSAGFTGVWLSETSPFTTVGNSQTDISVGMGNCQAGRFLVLTMTYQLFGTSTCSQLLLGPPPAFPDPTCLDCSFGMECSGLTSLNVNCSDCAPVAVEPTTWGEVKALYRN